MASFVDPAAAQTLTFAVEDPYRYPIGENEYDVVISGSVIEHVPKPWLWLPELARITRRGGHVITVNPVNWIFHQAPVDCWRIYPDGMKALCEQAGLEPVLSRFECAEPWYIPFLRTLRQFLRLATLRRPSFIIGEVLDTITIARKP